MTRFAAALNRARNGTVADPEADGNFARDAIRMFDSAPPVVSPWEIDADSEGPPPPDSADRTSRQHRVAARIGDFVRDHRPDIRRSNGGGVVLPSSVTPIAREQYNNLAAAIHHRQLERRVKVVMITSTVPDEGKTATSANLAMALSESYQRRVLLIDADLRRPSLHSLFGASNAAGLSDALAGHAPPLVHVAPQLSLLTAGSADGDPIRTLTSDRMHLLIDAARAEFDWVLVETAPIGVLPDAGLVASLADGTVLVVLAGSTARAMVRRATEAIGRHRILGVVLNGMAEPNMFAGYDYQDYYDETSR